MSELRALQHAFLGHLIGKGSEIVEQIQSTRDTSAEQRMGIYASGYRLRLKETLDTDYERLHGYLGDALFDQLKDYYIDQFPSRHTSLRYYGQHMLKLLANQMPFASMPILLELGKIEQAFNASFDAPNCVPVELTRLGELDPECWSSMQFEFHSSVQLLSCMTNSFSIWKAIAEEETPPAPNGEGSNWIIWRKELISRYRALSKAEARTLVLAQEGATFSEICEAMLDDHEQEQVPVQAIGYLQHWIRDQLLCGLKY